jgi:hypothetical protein
VAGTSAMGRNEPNIVNSRDNEPKNYTTMWPERKAEDKHIIKMRVSKKHASKFFKR